ncbi:MAG TPA: CHAT domain-containing tetratricopeptide repeat protein [Thermoanaerobaculia bacterium]|nr:CHAT domain-containing tetratricopeptide repeat protein [Thermoanaerobaculia bacterium]
MKLAAAAFALILPCIAAAQESPAELIAAAKKAYDTRHYKDALPLYEKARAAAEAAGDSIIAGRARLGLAALKTMDGKFDEGVVLAREAYAIFEKAGDARGLAGALQHLGNLHVGMAKFAEAADYFRKCADVPDSGRRPICLEHLGGAEETLGQFRQALATLQEAIAAAIAANDRTVHASAISGIADVYRNQGNAELAIQYDRKAMEMFRADGNTAMVSRTLNNIGLTYNLMGRRDLALAAYRENLALLEKLKYARGINISKMNIAATLMHLRRDEEAAPLLAELLPEFERLHDSDSRANVYRLLAEIDERRGNLSAALEHAVAAAAERTDEIKDVFLAKALLGHLYRKLGRIEDARTSLRGAIEAIESMHGQSTGGEVHFFDERSEPYAELAILLIGEGRIEEAFEYAEGYRSRVLVEALRNGPVPPRVTARDLAAALPRDAVLVEYLVTTEKSWAFVIAGEKIELRAIDADRETLARQAESFRALLADRRPDFRKTARELHRTLVAPIADLLSKRRSWILVPDGPLWNLPFQALVDARGSYLAEQAAIVYAPSTAAWLEMSRTPQPASTGARRELLAFGNPAGVPLPEAEAEVKDAARVYGADSAVYVRKEATEERFKAEAPRYRVLHVAGHGVLNDASPMHSYLLLAAGGAKKEDGFLEAGELMHMDLGADLVVLSACDTARGQYAAGEGIIGFTWALFAARCRAQVVSQWKVDSAATSILMRNFHRNVRNDRTRAASALQKTIVSMLKTKEYRHPFYWAGFVVMGDAL